MNGSSAHFSLWGDFEAADITGRLKLEPSAVYHKGELWEGASSPAKVSTWDLYCPPEAGDNMQEQLTALLKLLTPRAEQLKALAKEFHADMNLTTSCASAPTVFNLSYELIQSLAALHLNVNCFFESGEGVHVD